jgi:pimeloyl-ACP methyl ester carboxylesterase
VTAPTWPISVPETALIELRRRLLATRWPDEQTAADQGPALAQLRALCDHWATAYDWRRCEDDLNALGSARATIDGIGIHLLHVRSPEPGAVPLLMWHGWPGSVLEFRRLVGPLTDPVAHGGSREDAFHVVVPSMPGFGFSDKPTQVGWNVPRIADAWTDLMGSLGYDRFYAHGGDWGASVVDQIGRRSADRCAGLHFNLPLVFPDADEMRDADNVERRMMTRAMHYSAKLDGYAKEQSTRPQTIGYSLADSPVGLAAWIYTLLQDVGDNDGDPTIVISMDEIIDDIMLYWLPNAGASSARLYWEQAQLDATGGGRTQPRNPTPAGFSIFPAEAVQASRRWVERRYDVLHYEQLDHGGHFAALEQPQVLVQQIRSTFRSIR